MVSRSMVMGIFVLAGSSLLSAADPLIPPAPTSGSRIGTSAVPVVPPPPAPRQPGTAVPSVPVPAEKAPLAPAKPEVLSVPAPETTAPASPSVTVPATPPSSKLAPIPDTAPAPVVTGTPAAPSPVLVPAPQNSLPPGEGWVLSPDGSYWYQANSDGAVWGTSQGATTGLPQYNSFATQPNVLSHFHTGPAGGEHARYPYYSYRRPWYTPGPVSRNVNIVW